MLTAGARRAAVLGSPIAHSLSPALHRAAYRALGLDSWTYDAHELDASGLPPYVATLGPEWAGLSLTMPLKEAAFGIADEVSDLARDVGAINTLLRRADGGWIGDNTDVHGVLAALVEAGVGRPASSLVLGSGATARSVVAALAILGCRKVTFAVRTEARLVTLDQACRAGLEVDVLRLGEPADRSPGTEGFHGIRGGALPVGTTPLVVSTLPANTLSPAVLDVLLPPDTRLPGLVLLDVVYTDWPSPLARLFAGAGASVVSGFEMLLHQAAEQVHLMTGLVAPVEQMRVAGLAAMAPTP